MAVTLHISDSIITGLRLPESEIEPRLRLELALSLYGQGILSLGKAAELAGTDRAHLAEQLASREIPRNYGLDEFADDVNYARTREVPQTGKTSAGSAVIMSDPDILGGSPVLGGTRVPFDALLDYIEGGKTLDEFLDDFPTLTRERVIATLGRGKREESND